MGAIKRPGKQRGATRHKVIRKRPKMEAREGSRFPRVLRSLLAATYYVAASVSLTLFNKLLFQRYELASPVLVLLSQCIVTLVMLHILGALGVRATLDARALTGAQLRIHAPLAAAYISMLLLSLAALQNTSLLMYHTLRRIGIVVVLLLRLALDGTLPHVSTIIAAALIVAGALTAVANNLMWEPFAYAFALSANLCAAFYLLRLKRVRDALSLSNLQLLYLNNLVAFPVLALVFAARPPPSEIWQLFNVTEFTFLFLCSSSFALVLNHSTYVDTTVNDAVSHVVAAQVKDIILLFLSVFLVDNPLQRSPGMMRGALIAVVGSFVYAGGKVFSMNGEPSTGEKRIVQKQEEKQEELKQALLPAEENGDGTKR